MRAFTSAGGGVMFVPDKMERKGGVTYRDLLEAEKAEKPMRKLFGKRTADKGKRKAA